MKVAGSSLSMTPIFLEPEKVVGMFYIFHNGPFGQHISLCPDVASALKDLTSPYTPPDDPFIGSLQDPPWEHNYACSPAYHTVSRLLKPKEVVATLAPNLRIWMRKAVETHGGCRLELQAGLGRLHSCLDDEDCVAMVLGTWVE